MNKKEYQSLKFSDRIKLGQGDKCNASWQVDQGGGAYAVQCRTCGVMLQSDCVPKCLQNIDIETKTK